MNTSRTHWLKGLAALGAAVVAVGVCGLIATPAHAAPGEGGTGTVSVHKLEQPDAPFGPNDGSELTATDATPLVAGFTACSIDGIDLSNSAHWNRLQNIGVTLDGDGNPVASEGGTPLTLNCGTEQSTAAATGATAFTLPADRAYVVYESTPAENAISVAQPTLVTVPYPGNGSAGTPAWNYSPHIYPKNIVVGSGATKDGVIVGNSVTFDVNVPINPLAAGQTYTELRINDQLADSLRYTGGAVALTDKDGESVPLVAGDFTLTEPSADAEENEGVEVVLNLLGPGLAKIDANIGGTLTLTIDADAIGTGSTENEAQITVNGKSTDPGTGPEVPNPQNYFSGAHLVKQAQNKGVASTVPLAAAQFDVYTADDAATECPATPDGSATRVLTGETSAASGNTPNRVLAEGKYCVYETVVPAGYKGLVGGILLTVAGEDSSVTVVNNQIGTDPTDLPNLPITGATGSVLLAVGGAALLALGGVFLALRRRKALQEDGVSRS